MDDTLEHMNNDTSAQGAGEPQAQPETIEKEKYLRLAADFENFRRQESIARQDLAKWSAQAVVTDMLDLVDLIDAAVMHAPEIARSEHAWFKGLEKIQEQFAEKMKKYGVVRIKTEGKRFDPEAMEAIQAKPPDSAEQAGMVHSEVRSGYTMHDRVIRPARVIVYSH